MSYSYEAMKPKLFTDDGQRVFLKIRDAAKDLLAKAGAVTAAKLIDAGGSGEVWLFLACIDRLVELVELLEISNPRTFAEQDRVFIAPYRS